MLCSVTSDWIRALPREKSEIFESSVRHWERSFAMVSVALDDAFAMRARGELVCASQQVSVSAALLTRISTSLISFCESLANRGRFIRHIPSVEPLNPEFFRSQMAQSAAAWNEFLHCVAFGSRPRFVHKLRILSSTFERLDREFGKAAGDIARAASAGSSWKALDQVHYDFNTCLRETEVILKSFLRALPIEHLAGFTTEVERPRPRRLRLRLRPSRASA
jgi:hypothetical protein